MEEKWKCEFLPSYKHCISIVFPGFLCSSTVKMLGQDLKISFNFYH